MKLKKVYKSDFHYKKLIQIRFDTHLWQTQMTSSTQFGVHICRTAFRTSAQDNNDHYNNYDNNNGNNKAWLKRLTLTFIIKLTKKVDLKLFLCCRHAERASVVHNLTSYEADKTMSLNSRFFVLIDGVSFSIVVSNRVLSMTILISSES